MGQAYVPFAMHPGAPAAQMHCNLHAQSPGNLLGAFDMAATDGTDINPGMAATPNHGGHNRLRGDANPTLVAAGTSTDASPTRQHRWEPTGSCSKPAHEHSLAAKLIKCMAGCLHVELMAEKPVVAAPAMIDAGPRQSNPRESENEDDDDRTLRPFFTADKVPSLKATLDNKGKLQWTRSFLAHASTVSGKVKILAGLAYVDPMQWALSLQGRDDLITADQRLALTIKAMLDVNATEAKIFSRKIGSDPDLAISGRAMIQSIVNSTIEINGETEEQHFAEFKKRPYFKDGASRSETRLAAMELYTDIQELAPQRNNGYMCYEKFLLEKVPARHHSEQWYQRMKIDLTAHVTAGAPWNWNWDTATEFIAGYLLDAKPTAFAGDGDKKRDKCPICEQKGHVAKDCKNICKATKMSTCQSPIGKKCIKEAPRPTEANYLRKDGSKVPSHVLKLAQKQHDEVRGGPRVNEVDATQQQQQPGQQTQQNGLTLPPGPTASVVNGSVQSPSYAQALQTANATLPARSATIFMPTVLNVNGTLPSGIGEDGQITPEAHLAADSLPEPPEGQTWAQFDGGANVCLSRDEISEADIASVGEIEISGLANAMSPRRFSASLGMTGEGLSWDGSMHEELSRKQDVEVWHVPTFQMGSKVAVLIAESIVIKKFGAVIIKGEGGAVMVIPHLDFIFPMIERGGLYFGMIQWGAPAGDGDTRSVPRGLGECQSMVMQRAMEMAYVGGTQGAMANSTEIITVYEMDADARDTFMNEPAAIEQADGFTCLLGEVDMTIHQPGRVDTGEAATAAAQEAWLMAARAAPWPPQVLGQEWPALPDGMSPPTPASSIYTLGSPGSSTDTSPFARHRTDRG